MTLRVGVIGCGFMGQAVHIPSILSESRAELLAVSDIRPILAAGVAKRWHVPLWYADYHELLENQRVDAVYVLTDKFSHYQITMDALKAGKHVFVEKPLATKYEEAVEVAEEAKRRSLVVLVGYMKRYDAGVQLARDKISSAGPPVYARAAYLGGNWTFGDPQIRPLSTQEQVPPIPRSYPDIPGHLVALYDDLVEQIHSVNTVRYLFGEPKVISARFHSGVLLSHLDAGFPISLEFGWINTGRWTEEYAAYYKDSELIVDLPPPLYRNATASVTLRGASYDTVYARVGFKWAFERETESFVSAVLDSRPYPSGAQDAAKDLEIAEELVRAVSRSEGKGEAGRLNLT